LDTWYDVKGEGREGPCHEPNADGPDAVQEGPSEAV
jgi:hypothetical protein